MLHDQLVEKKRLEAQLEVARQVQLALLPARDPEVDGFDISAYNFSTEEVSGDYYDFVKPYEDHLGVVIADVSGKGVPASLISAIASAPGSGSSCRPSRRRSATWRVSAAHRMMARRREGSSASAWSFAL